MTTPLPVAEQPVAAKNFAAFWQGKGHEKARPSRVGSISSASWDVESPESCIEFEDATRMDEGHGSSDAFIPSTRVFAELQPIGRKNTMMGRKMVVERRKFAMLILAFAMVLILAGCGQTENTFDARAGGEQEAVAAISHGDSNYAGCDRPDGTAGPSEEAAGAKHVPLDIAGCDSFAQIVDKLQAGQGYAHATIDGEEVLLVTGHTFDNAGQMASIAADIYHCEGGVPAYMGSVTSGGTAYPLAIADGKLYACGNHCAHKYTARNGSLMLDMKAHVIYHAGGEPEYFVASEVRDLATGPDGRVEDDSCLSAIYDECRQGEIIAFKAVLKK